MINDILANLDAKTRARVIAASEATTEKIATPSYIMNKALDGGFGRGRQTLIYGNKSASKSSLCLQTIATAQKQGLSCAYIDSEDTFDPEWATRLGVDCSELLLSQDKSIPDAVGVGCDLMDANIDLLIIDSISSLLPSTYFEDNGTLKDNLEGTKQIGQLSKELSIAVNKFNYANKSTALILVSQMRNQLTTYGASQKPMGGLAVTYFSSTVMRLWSSASDKEQIKDKVNQGNKEIQIPVGRPVQWLVEYNKIGAPGLTGSYDFYYKGDVGIDYIGEVVDFAISNGIIIKKGSWFQYGEKSLQGRPAVVSFFRKDNLALEELEKKLETAGF